MHFQKQLTLLLLLLVSFAVATKFFPVGLRANLENVLQEQADVIMVCGRCSQITSQLHNWTVRPNTYKTQLLRETFS